MPSAREVLVKIIGDNSSLNRALKSSENDLSSFQSGVQSKFSGFDPLKDIGASFGGLIGGTVAVGAAFTFLKGTIDAAMQDAKEQANLAVIIRDNTQATDEMVAANEKWITSTQNATGVEDSHIREGLVPLVAATHNVAEAHALMQTAMDISAARGLDLNAVSVALSKAYNGNVASLGRLGIQYKDTNGDVLSFAEVVARANDTFGGATAAAADTAAGKLAILEVRFKDLKEQIGNEFLPVLTNVADVASTSFIPALSGTLGVLDQFYNKLQSGLATMYTWETAFLNLGKGGGGTLDVTGFSGGGGGGAGSPTGKTGLGRNAVPGLGAPTAGSAAADSIFVAGLTGVAQAMGQQKYQQDALAAFYRSLGGKGGGGGGGGGGGKSDAQKAADDAKAAQEKAFKEYLDLLVNQRDEARRIEDEMYQDQKLTLDQYMAILEKRLAGETENSTAWIAIKDQERQVLRDHGKQEVQDAKDAAAELKKISDQQIQDAQDAADKMMEIQDNQFEVGAISTGDYIAILQARLGQFEQFTNEWTRIYEEIQKLGGSVSGGSGGGGAFGNMATTTFASPGQSGPAAPITVAGNIYVQMDGQYDPNKVVEAVQKYAQPNGGISIPGGVTAV